MNDERVYYFSGTVLPERAQIGFALPEMDFHHDPLGFSGWIRISVIFNNVSVRIRTPNIWNIFDLRNVVWYLVTNQLNIFGFYLGHSYDLDISRVVCDEQGVDYVFGIDVPAISSRLDPAHLEARAVLLVRKTSGPQGLLLNRALRDLNAALDTSEDTAFYCYRAIEALRNHSTLKDAAVGREEDLSWESFRTKARVDKSVLISLKDRADPERHGHVVSRSDADRSEILTTTWNIVETYFESLPDLGLIKESD